MKTYEFSLVLGASEVTDADCDTLHEAGCDDGTVVTRNGVTHIAFDREAESLEERRSFWMSQFVRCIRCYACRQACPGCYCFAQCFVEQLDPQWVGIRISPGENEVWHTIRAFHLAGRCISCNECERVCPVDIPLSLLNRKLEKEVLQLFGFRTGMSADAVPPFATFNKEEKLGIAE